MESVKYHRFNGMKILVHADRLQQIAAGKMPFPIDWHIYPSNICNHTCDWCMFRQNKEQQTNPRQLSHEQLTRAVMDAARTGARLIHFSGGGEPLVNKHTLSAIRLANTNNVPVALSTNGTYLLPEVAKEVSYIRVSLNAGTQRQHDLTNHANDPRSDWQTILKNIAAAVKVKRKDVGIGFVVDHTNYRDIPSCCNLAADLGADFVHIRPAFWYHSDQDAATRQVMTETAEMVAAAQRELGKRVYVHATQDKFEGFWTPRTYNKCRAVWTGTCLTATGDFAVCQDRTDLRFGKAYQRGEATFEEVWQSEEHQQLVERITDPGELSKCPRCVWNNRNEVIEQVFVKDTMRLDLV